MTGTSESFGVFRLEFSASLHMRPPPLRGGLFFLMLFGACWVVGGRHTTLPRSLHRAFGLGFRFGEPTEDAIVRCCVESHLGVARRVVLHLEWQGCRLALFSYALFSLACFRLLISLE